MKLEIAKSWKTDILSRWLGRTPKHEVLPRSLVQEIQQLGRRKPNRISVGYSKYETQFFLELRIYSQNHSVIKLVRNIREAVDGEANIQLWENMTLECPKSKSDLEKKCRPLALGASIGHSYGGAGTIGGFLEKRGSVGLLSCSHVLAPLDHKNVAQGDHIYQPGPKQEGSAKGADDIGFLEDWTVLRAGLAQNESDSAMAFLHEDIGVYAPSGGKPGNYVPFAPDPLKYAGRPILRLSTDKMPDNDRFLVNTKVHKIGHSTGFTTGQLLGSSFGLAWIGEYAFNNVLQIEWPGLDDPFSDGGDSGSLVFTGAHPDGNLYGLGILFAKGTGLFIDTDDGKKTGASFACDLNDALDNLDADWLE